MKKGITVALFHTLILFVYLIYPNRGVSQSAEDSLYLRYQKRVEHKLLQVPHHTDSLIAASRSLIESSQSREEASLIAGIIFNRFTSSTVMGDESIAIAIAKEYFLTSQLDWNGQGGIPLLKLFVEFNEKSLIGLEAPPFNLFTLSGEALSLHSIEGRYTLLLFVDPQCEACHRELPKVIERLNHFSHLNVSLCVINSSKDSVGMAHYYNIIKEKVAPTQKFTLLYNPYGGNDLQREYNLLSTPKLYLLDSKKKIIGRNLQESSLGQLLTAIEQKEEESIRFCEEFVPTYLSLFDFNQEESFQRAFEPLFIKSSSNGGELFNPLFIHLFLTLAHSPHEELKETAYKLAQHYIIEKKELWHYPSFTQELLPKLLRKIEQNRVGAQYQQVKLLDSKKRVNKITFKRKRYHFIYFFNPQCAICKPFTFELRRIYKELKRERVEIVAIYSGANHLELLHYQKEEQLPWRVLYYPNEEKSPLIELYQIEELPMGYLVNSRGEIVAKGINSVELQRLIK